MPDTPSRHDDICDVPGVLVGHETDTDAATGCTVVLCAWPALGAVDVRGGAPATRETDLLSPLCFMREVHAVLLTGGSAFGLDAAAGVMRTLERRGIGFDAGPARVPIVPAAALFDLGIGQSHVRPDEAMGGRAIEAAAGGPITLGSVGAGTGASVGKQGGLVLAMKGGVGSASATLPDGHIIGVLAAVNAGGDIYDETTGRIVAGARSPTGRGWLADDLAAGMPGPAAPPLRAGSNTTLAVVATDAPWSKAELAKIAQMAHDGLALAIRPAHTPMDGDVVFALSTARPGTAAPAPTGWPVALALAGALAARTLARAVVKAVQAATGLHGVPALRDLPTARE
jgi:L-aminopeptidase/D-esterase-like protein